MKLALVALVLLGLASVCDRSFTCEVRQRKDRVDAVCAAVPPDRERA